MEMSECLCGVEIGGKVILVEVKKKGRKGYVGRLEEEREDGLG